MRNRDRDDAIAQSYLGGKSLREVGGEFDISGSRVHQILIHDGVALRPWGKNKPVPRKYPRRACAVCGDDFQPASARSKYCGHKCSGAGRDRGRGKQAYDLRERGLKYREIAEMMG